MLGIPRRPMARGIFAACDIDDRLDRQMIFFGEFEISLIVPGHTHYRPGAVSDQHIISHPYGYGLAADGMAPDQTGRHALFFLRREFRFDGWASLAFLDERRQFRLAARRKGRQRMLRRHRAATVRNV